MVPSVYLGAYGCIFSIVSPYPYVTVDYMTTDVHAYIAQYCLCDLLMTQTD